MLANHSRIYSAKDAYCSFPHLVKTSDNELLLVFRQAGAFSAQAAVDNLTTHHDADSRILLTRSSDLGQTWSQPQVIYDTQYGVNDPALTVLSDGTILLRVVLLEVLSTNSLNSSDLKHRKIFSHRVEHGLVSTVIGNLVLRSEDNGCSWTSLGISDPPEISGGCSRDPILELPDHSLLMPIYTGSPQRTEVASVIRSFDRGETWTSPSTIMIDPDGSNSQQHGLNYSETSLIHFGKGKLLALTRCDETFFTGNGQFVPVGGLGHLRTSISMDSGLSWTLPRDSGICGTPGSLLQVSNNTVLATYGYRKENFGVRCCFSYDMGLNWDIENEITLRDDSYTWDCGYPFTIEIEPNRYFTVYYITSPDGLREIWSTSWHF